jgi:carboxymethylenebutenolidase
MMTTFRAGGKAAEGYLSLPKTEKGPGVLVLHAWWGLTDFFKGLCGRLADQGFVSLAPDLYHGATASTIEEAKNLRSKLKSTIVAKEVTGALEYLSSHPAVNGNKVGVMGFSLGAYYALGLAVLKPNDVSAVVIFYGTRAANYSKTEAAFLGHFAEDDKWAPVKKIRQLESSIRSGGGEVIFHSYPGTKHWFFEKDRPEAYNRIAAEQAWRRTVKFLRSKLT